MKNKNLENTQTRSMRERERERERVLVRDPETRSLFASFRNLSLHLTAVQDDKISLFKNLFCKQSPKTCRPEFISGPQKAFTLAEVLMAKRVSDKASSLRLVRASEPKAPTKIINKLCAFTLAEVLITLAIIGVVAALTIPTVVRNYQKQQTVTKLKKVYNTLNQAVQMATVEHGNPTTWDYNSCKGFYETYFKKHIKVAKEIGNVATPDYHWLNGDTVTGGYIPSASNYKVVLTDGVLIAFEGMSSKALFHIDINGYDNPPNVAGKDYFAFELYKSTGRIVPRLYYSRTLNDMKGSCKKPMGSGELCVTKIMHDGWQIKDDYPW